MEGLGDRPFRKALSKIGGFDEACTEFLRVPSNAHVASLAKQYQKEDTFPIPQAVQIMGSHPELMGAMAQELAKKGAPRIDLNCGCPSNTVTGRGAGSSLLKNPSQLYQIAKTMVEAVSVPVTAKLRSGYEDISLFRENLLAAQESGVKFVTLHPRTKAEGYAPPARWDLIAEAKTILKIPVVGNGDILKVEDAVRMLKETGCDALMIGRGSVINPWIFHHIRAFFAGETYVPEKNALQNFVRNFWETMVETGMPISTQLNKLKQLMSFLFKANAPLLEKRGEMLSKRCSNPAEFLAFVFPILQEG
nr:tRNA-dihydrouridine synthase family protein [Parachlamydia sp. AcF125]